MKLLSVKLPKKSTIRNLVERILQTYPDADAESIFGTLYKSGHKTKLCYIEEVLVEVKREVKILTALGVK